LDDPSSSTGGDWHHPGEEEKEEEMTREERIAQIKARVEKATEGPWVRGTTEFSGYWIRPEWSATDDVVHRGIEGDGGVLDPDDAEFIAAAREDVPWLVAELEAAEMDRLKEESGFLILREQYLAAKEELEEALEELRKYRAYYD
jgi:hypothetical protein